MFHKFYKIFPLVSIISKYNNTFVRKVGTAKGNFTASNLYFNHTKGEDESNFKSIKYFVTKNVAHIQLHRPSSLNAIDVYMLGEIERAVNNANLDNSVNVILLSGGKTFCSGYDLKLFAECPRGTHPCSQEMPWDPFLDFNVMKRCNDSIMSLWRSFKPVIAKIRGVAIGGGSDIALSCDVTFMAEDAKIGYPPARVWGCPTTAMWVYRIGIEKAKRLLFTGDLLSGVDAAKIGLVGEAVPDDQLDETVDNFLDSIKTVPTNQLFFQKQVINNAIEMMGLGSSQLLATFFDGMTRHTPEGVEFQEKAYKMGFKKAVLERDFRRKS